MNTKLIIIFGKPGAGKSFVADILRNTFGYTIHDGDDDLPGDMKLTLDNKLPITDNMRKRFIENIIASTTKLAKNYPKLVIQQTFLKEFMRKQFIEVFPNAQFILIECDDAIRETRYMKRRYFNLGLPYLQHMSKLFEAPHIPHALIYNNNEGTKEVERGLRSIIQGNPSPLRQGFAG
jgi:gluconokinase